MRRAASGMADIGEEQGNAGLDVTRHNERLTQNLSAKSDASGYNQIRTPLSNKKLSARLYVVYYSARQRGGLNHRATHRSPDCAPIGNSIRSRESSRTMSRYSGRFSAIGQSARRRLIQLMTSRSPATRFDRKVHLMAFRVNLLMRCWQLLGTGHKRRRANLVRVFIIAVLLTKPTWRPRAAA